MKYCPKCGTELKENSKFCGKCGTEITEAKITASLKVSSDTAVNDNKSETNKIEPVLNDVENPISTQDTANDNNTINDNDKDNANEIESTSDKNLTDSLIEDSIEKQAKKMPAKNIEVKDKKVHPKIKKKINKLVIILPIIVIVVLIGGFLGLKYYLNNKNSTTNVISSFVDSVHKKDSKTLYSLFCSKDNKKAINEDNINAMIRYLNDNPDVFDEVVKNLKKDEKLINKVKSKNINSLLAKEDKFALTIKDTNFLYTSYGITFNPIYITVDSNIFPIDIIIGKDKQCTINSAKDSKNTKIGPLIPGIYNLNCKSKDTFGNELSQNNTVSPNNPSSYTEYTFFADYNVVHLESNINQANIIINNIDTGKTVNDLKDGAIILSSKDTIVLSYTSNGQTYTSMSAYRTSGSVQCNFSSSDYNKIYNRPSSYSNNAYSNSANSRNNSNNSNSTTSSSNSNSSMQNSSPTINKYANKNYIIDKSFSEKLTFRDLNPYTVEELFIAKYEILARHGYVFTAQPKLQQFFESKSWYSANSNYDGSLDGIQSENYQAIKTVEFLKMAKNKCGDITSDYVLPYSNSQVYSRDTIAQLNDWELVVARNELFARYGYPFGTQELLQHFNSKSWYHSNDSIDDTLELNSFENDNLSIILEIENARVDAATTHDLQ